MERRKRIALITAVPEDLHGNNIIEGIRIQCEKYDYDFYIFSAMTHLENHMQDYVTGESNIFNLANYEELDGVIIDTVNVFYGQSGSILRKLRESLSAYPKLAVASLELPLEGIPLIPDQNEEVLREMVRHMVVDHGKRKVAVLTGYSGNEVAESRLNIFLDELGKQGITVPEEWIHHGEFWYFNGDTFAKKILNGEIERPEAVLCACDTIAIGLIETLVEGGIRVPEDVAVLGFDGIVEGKCIVPALSTFPANDISLAANAVDKLREKIDPGKPIEPYKASVKNLLQVGESCGCKPQYADLLSAVKTIICQKGGNPYSSHVFDDVKIGQLLESYVMERLTGSKSPEDCIQGIFYSVYLLAPYQYFCLALREDWLDTEKDKTTGYPENMQLVLQQTLGSDNFFYEKGDRVTFPTKKMLPETCQNYDEPGIFIFTPVHFNERSLGYSVLIRSIHEKCHMSMVYRNWLRYVNNALEMTRRKEQLRTMSIYDGMTGCLNRHGMDEELERLLSTPGEKVCYVGVVDMDGLKKVNDTHGHEEGDFAIRLVARAMKNSANPEEILVRAGGDEFYLFRMVEDQLTGKEEERILDRMIRFQNALREEELNSGKPYRVSASIGCAYGTVHDRAGIEELLRDADRRMYIDKAAKKFV